jgi:hypothetical protein
MPFMFKNERVLTRSETRRLDYFANEIGKENVDAHANFFTYKFLNQQNIEFFSRYGHVSGYNLIGWDPERYYVTFHLDPVTGKFSTSVPAYADGPLKVSDELKRKIVHFLNTLLETSETNSAARSHARTGEIKEELVETALAEPHRAWGTEVGAEAIVGRPGITTMRMPGSFNTEEEALAAAYANLNRKSKSRTRRGRRSARKSRRNSKNGKNRK